jgi:hypothetical protein
MYIVRKKTKYKIQFVGNKFQVKKNTRKKEQMEGYLIDQLF